MKVFTCTDHAGHYPVGVASIVVAENENRAWLLLSDALEACGLVLSDFTLQEVDLTQEQAIVLCNGDY